MVFKVLLGLLAAVAVTGTAAFYGLTSGPESVPGGCPLSAAQTTTCSTGEELADESSCCAAKSRASAACCAEGAEMAAAGGDAMAALTGGVCLGR